MNLATKQYFVSRDIHFYEHIFPFRKDSYKAFMQPLPEVVFTSPTSHTSFNDVFLSLSEDSSSSSASRSCPSVPMDRIASPSVEQPPIQSASAEVPTPPTLSPPSPRRSSRPRKNPAWMTDFVIPSLPGLADSVPSAVTAISSIPLSDTHKALMASIDNSHDPATFSKAVQDSKWCQAMDNELKALEENKTWEITTLRPGKRAIGCKWIYRIKFHSDGRIDRCKARLIALGCRQRYGVDYWETFAPVAKMTTCLLYTSPSPRD